MAKQTSSALALYSQFTFSITGVGVVKIIARDEWEAHQKLHETYSDLQDSCREYRLHPNPLSLRGPVEYGESIPYQPNKLRRVARQSFTVGMEVHCSLCGRNYNMCGCDVTCD